MSIENYEKMLEINEINMSIREALEKYENGAELIDARELLDSLKRKYF